jgi:hypothetical protein
MSRFSKAAAAGALALVVAAGCVPTSTGGSTEPSSASALPGTPGHFLNDTFSFDYPVTWRTISGGFFAYPLQVDGVIGTGDWRNGCWKSASGVGCGPDTVDVSGGRIVIRIWRRVAGPVQICTGNTKSNATFGPNAVLETQQDGLESWEIRRSDQEFGWAYNVMVDVYADGPARLAEAQALVASFRWADAGSGVVACPSGYPVPS